jgi:hypothetical protein
MYRIFITNCFFSRLRFMFLYEIWIFSGLTVTLLLDPNEVTKIFKGEN